jgi:hypothetical protein
MFGKNIFATLPYSNDDLCIGIVIFLLLLLELVAGTETDAGVVAKIIVAIVLFLT